MFPPFFPHGHRRLALCAGLSSSAVAWAGPGDHIQVGAAEITPSVTVGVEGRTNAYLSESRPVAAFDFVFSPGLRVTVDAPKVYFLFDARYELRKYFDADVADDLDQFSNFQGQLRLDLFPEAVVGFSIRDQASLRNRANDQAFRDNALISQVRNDLGAGIPIRVGDVALEPGFDWAYQVYRIPGSGDQVDFNNRHAYGPTLDLQWRFFPNTSFFVQGRVDFNRWGENWLSTGGPAAGAGTTFDYGQFFAKPDSLIFKASTGVRGRITRHFLIDLELGYGYGDYDEQSVIEASSGGTEADPVAQRFGTDVSATDAILAFVRPRFDLGWSEEARFGQQISVFYRKDFQDSFVTNYVHAHGVGASLESRWGKFVSTRLSGGARFESYVGEIQREDVFPGFDGAIVFLPIRALPIELGVSYQNRISNDATVQYDNVVGRVMVSFVY